VAEEESKIFHQNHHAFGTLLQTKCNWSTSSTTRSPMGHMFLLQLMTPEMALSQAIGGVNPQIMVLKSWGKGYFKPCWVGSSQGEEHLEEG